MANDKNFYIGDKVGWLNDTLSGIITKMDKNHITLKCDEGFTYTLPKHETVKLKNFDDAIFSSNTHKVLAEKEVSIFNKNKTLKEKKKPLKEIDLHIHQLVDSEKGMTNFEMLSIQLQTAKKQLEIAIKEKALKIIFIHGIGEGVLKAELHQLFNKYPVEFYEASYQKYGQGATEVYIYQNSSF